MKITFHIKQNGVITHPCFILSSTKHEKRHPMSRLKLDLLEIDYFGQVLVLQTSEY